jgi:ketosteroid isomerase-like protein
MPEGNIEIVRLLYHAFEQARIEIEQIEEAHDLVAVVVGLEARGRGSGLQTEMRQSHLWTFRHGKATRFQWFTDPDASLRALREGCGTRTGTWPRSPTK